jgi:phosphinothricin acetyltransferase
MPVLIRPMSDEDSTAVLTIYRQGIHEGNATFETTVPTWAEFLLAKVPELRFVAAADDGRVLGWVAASRVSSRPVYAGVVEHSVYVDPEARGRGVGGLLLAALIDATESAGIWTIESRIFPENEASAALHRRAGFRNVGIRERLGQHDGRWRDVVLIERRSAVAGR